MNNFKTIKQALEYIDNHLDEPVSFETLAERFHFSPYYFNRVFTAITGKTITAHIRDRRLSLACMQISATDKSILEICINCGFNSAQAFSRAFKEAYGLPPIEYRRQGYEPVVTTVDEMIMKFTNRLNGGIYLNPKIIKQDALIIAGVSGDGNKTGDVWNAFQKLNSEKPIINKLSSNGYEIRIYNDGACTVHVGFSVTYEQVDPSYTLFKLPASKYASFDVYVANGYESENNAMDQWLQTNKDGYTEKFLDGQHYCVEYYDERFHGSESGSIIEIWIPIEKK